MGLSHEFHIKCQSFLLGTPTQNASFPSCHSGRSLEAVDAGDAVEAVASVGSVGSVTKGSGSPSDL